jgi:hypothetical protein
MQQALCPGPDWETFQKETAEGNLMFEEGPRKRRCQVAGLKSLLKKWLLKKNK